MLGRLVCVFLVGGLRRKKKQRQKGELKMGKNTSGFLKFSMWVGIFGVSLVVFMGLVFIINEMLFNILNSLTPVGFIYYFFLTVPSTIIALFLTGLAVCLYFDWIIGD